MSAVGEEWPGTHDRAKTTVLFLQQEGPQHPLQMWTVQLQSPHLHPLQDPQPSRLGLSNIGILIYHIHFVDILFVFINYFLFTCLKSVSFQSLKS